MGIVARNARRGYYSRENHRGVTYVGLYWHFLDLAWLGLYATILWATWFRSGG
jgi:heme/copper-type cytochrome/quinol oxidase subunit 3